MKISTLKRFLCTVSMGCALLLVMSVESEAQRRYPPSHAPAYGLRNQRPYGQQVSARRHYRNELRRDLIRHQRLERQAYHEQRGQQREIYGNSRDWRYQQRENRAALRLHQREEKAVFRQTWKNNKRQR
jgi:hypothetical protein